MTLAPVEFTVGEGDDALTLRHHPLPAIPLAREYDKLIKRLDTATGVLDTLAFTFTESDFSEMFAGGFGGIFKWLKAVSMALGEESLPDFLMGYVAVGKVQLRVAMPGGGGQWIDLTEEAVNELSDQTVLFVAAWQVLRGLFAPFGRSLQRLYAKAQVPSSGVDTSLSEATDEPEAPTSESPSST